MTKYLYTILIWGSTVTIASATNFVTIQSRSVPAGAGFVTVGIYLQNDVALAAVVLPLEIRSVTSGSFIADTLVVNAANRLTTHLTGYTVKSYFPSEDNNRFWECGGGGYKTRGLPDFINPDAFFYVVNVGQEDSVLSPGTDGAPPGGSPSALVSFGVTSTNGTFEIDTTCITPANHLLFVTSSPIVGIVPGFTKAVIEIGCECDCHTDPQCDGYHDIVDWLKIKNVAQGSSAPIPDPNPFCPVVTTDVNCDGLTNNTDKNLMYGVVFLGDDPDSVFCNPCP